MELNKVLGVWLCGNVRNVFKSICKNGVYFGEIFLNRNCFEVDFGSGKHWTHFSRWKIILMMLATSLEFIFEFLKWWIATKIVGYGICLDLFGKQVILKFSKGKLFGKSSLFWNLVFDLNIKEKCVDFYFELVLK